MANFTVPVLFIIFNKIKETQEVFKTIQYQKPLYLFIAADGPRSTKEGELDKCIFIRKWILDHIDWPCEIKTLFRDQNVGCGRGPSEAITWFFNHVNQGIILEDDCLPNETFFKFCSDLLEKYEYDEKISIISGNNFQQVQPMRLSSDYYYSVFPSSNGWATWKRSWDGFDYQMSSWPTINKKILANTIFDNKEYHQWWINYFDWLYKNRPDDMWDFQFHYLCMVRNQLAVIPKANLVKNIGYGPDATHSQDPDSYFANVPVYKLDFPLNHPHQISRNYEADLFIQRMLFGKVEAISNFKKLKRVIKHIIRYKNQ